MDVEGGGTAWRNGVEGWSGRIEWRGGNRAGLDCRAAEQPSRGAGS